MYNIVSQYFSTLQNDHHSKSAFNLSPWKVAIILLTLFSLHYITLHPCDLFCYWKFIPLNPCNLFPLNPHFSPLWQPPIYSLFLWVCFCFVMVVFVRFVFCVFIFLLFVFFCFVMFVFQISHINEVMVFVFLWVISFSIIVFMDIHIITKGKISLFFIAE